MLAALARFCTLVLILGIGIYIVYYSSYSEVFSYQALRDAVQSWGIWAWLAFLLFFALCGVLLIPGLVPTFVGAILFGPWLGTVLNLVGTMLASSLSFFVAKILGRPFVHELVGEKLDLIQQKIKGDGFRIIFLLRLVPVFPFFGVNYAAGLSKIEFKDYFFGTLLGSTPPLFVYTFLFAKLGEKVFAGIALVDLLSAEILVLLLALLMLVLIPFYFMRKKQISL